MPEVGFCFLDFKLLLVLIRNLFDILMCSTKDFPTIFRELRVWKSIMAPPDLIVRGRIEDARRVRAAEATAAAAAARSSGGGRSKGGRPGKKKKKKKGKKGRRKR